VSANVDSEVHLYPKGSHNLFNPKISQDLWTKLLVWMATKDGSLADRCLIKDEETTTTEGSGGQSSTSKPETSTKNSNGGTKLFQPLVTWPLTLISLTFVAWQL